MREVLAAIDGWARCGERVALATVVEVRKSAPRAPGAKLAVSESGEIAGSVSGGCVEAAVVQAAEDVLRGGPARLLSFGIADEQAWEVGLPCGGEIDVWVDSYEDQAAPGAEDTGSWRAARRGFAGVARADGRAALVTVLDGGRVGANRLVTADGRSEGSLGEPRLDMAATAAAAALMWGDRPRRVELEGASMFVDVTFPAPRLLIFGAVDLAAALCRFARASGWRPYVIDPRARFAQPARFPEAEEVVVAWPREAVARLGGIDAATAIAVLTHDPKLDDAALMLALDSPAGYVGAMGSRLAQRRRRERLLAAGASEGQLDRIAAPIGLDLGGLTPEETALSIMAEVVALRHGHAGGRLSRSAGRIHEVQA